VARLNQDAFFGMNRKMDGNLLEEGQEVYFLNGLII